SPVAPQDQSRRVHAERTAQSRSATPVLRANTHDSTRSAPPLGVGRPQTSTPPCPRPHLQNQPHPPLPTHQSWTCHHHDNLRRSPLHRPTTHRYRRIIHAPPTTISGLTRRGRGSFAPQARLAAPPTVLRISTRVAMLPRARARIPSALFPCAGAATPCGRHERQTTLRPVRVLDYRFERHARMPGRSVRYWESVRGG